MPESSRLDGDFWKGQLSLIGQSVESACCIFGMVGEECIEWLLK